MKVVYDYLHWIELDSRFASYRPHSFSEPSYIGFGCKRSVCNRPYLLCCLCKHSYTYSPNINK